MPESTRISELASAVFGTPAATFVLTAFPCVSRQP